MFDTVNGLPIHPLVVHAIVVLVPLCIVAAVAVSIRPAWRQGHGWVAAALLAVSTILTPVATSSGEALEKRVGRPGEHAELGEQLVWFELVLLALLVVLLYADRVGRTGTLMTILPIAVVIASVAAGVQVYRVGDSGARAAWGDVPAARAGTE